MPLRVCIELVRPRHPDAAVVCAVSPLFEGLARGRTLHVLELSWQTGPGTSVAPWTLAGLAAAAQRADLQLEWETLELSESRPPRTASWSAALPGTRRPRALPKSWVGRHACIVLPCVTTDSPSRRQPSTFGPIESALRALDERIGGPRDRPSARAAGHLLATAFASLTFVLDGTWWAELGGQPSAARSLTALDRCFACGIDHPSPSWMRMLGSGLDPWLAHKLRLSPVRTQPELAVRASGSGEPGLWPRVHLHGRASGGALGRGQARRALQALWKPAPERTRLAPAVPGELARAWHAWNEASARPSNMRPEPTPVITPRTPAEGRT